MPRLFVALDLPAAVTERLTAHQPVVQQGIRLITPAQMHLTLHFIGEAEMAPIGRALSAIAYSAFSLSIKGAGQFRTAAGIILWAGVVITPALSGLHAQVGDRLARLGIKLDDRPYRPHITLARCGKGIRREALVNYLGEREPDIPDIGISSFSLYSSILSHEGPRYQREESYPLT